MSGYRKYATEETYAGEPEGSFMTMGSLFALLGQLMEEDDTLKDRNINLCDELGNCLSRVSVKRIAGLAFVTLHGPKEGQTVKV
jgi:hypothetical protein